MAGQPFASSVYMYRIKAVTSVGTVLQLLYWYCGLTPSAQEFLFAIMSDVAPILAEVLFATLDALNGTTALLRDVKPCVAAFAATTMPQTLLLPEEQQAILSDRVSQYLVDLPPYKNGVEKAKLSLLWPSWTSTTAPVLLLARQLIRECVDLTSLGLKRDRNKHPCCRSMWLRKANPIP